MTYFCLLDLTLRAHHMSVYTPSFGPQLVPQLESGPNSNWALGCPFVDLLFLVSYFLLLETVEEAFHFFSFWLSVKRLTDLGWWWL